MAELAKALGVETDGEDVEMGEASGRSRSAFETVQRAVEKVVREGYSATQVLTQVSDGLVASVSMSFLGVPSPSPSLPSLYSTLLDLTPHQRFTHLNAHSFATLRLGH